MIMKVSELVRQLSHFDPEAEVDVSVDVSTGDDDAGNRAFGEIVELQGGPDDNKINILCIGSLNFK
jgi:hypothetical protein